MSWITNKNTIYFSWRSFNQVLWIFLQRRVVERRIRSSSASPSVNYSHEAEQSARFSDGAFSRRGGWTFTEKRPVRVRGYELSRRLQFSLTDPETTCGFSLKRQNVHSSVRYVKQTRPCLEGNFTWGPGVDTGAPLALSFKKTCHVQWW